MADIVGHSSGRDSWGERPVTFGRARSLVGVLTEPREMTGRPVLILGAGILHRVGPSRASVHLARSLASRGHPTLRFDLSGIGDSPRASGEGLTAAVIADIRDAIECVLTTAKESEWANGVALVGYCSGADNAFYVGADDDRVRAAALFDPLIHPTGGFRRREWVRRLTSARSWWNVVSGRSLFLRIRARLRRDVFVRPPDYYGLLVAGPEDADRRASRLRERGVDLLFILSAGCRGYCNSPEQVRESLPHGFSPERFRALWAPDIDHVLSRADHVGWLCASVGDWLGTAGHRRASSAGDSPTQSQGAGM